MFNKKSIHNYLLISILSTCALYCPPKFDFSKFPLAQKLATAEIPQQREHPKSPRSAARYRVTVDGNKAENMCAHLNSDQEFKDAAINSRFICDGIAYKKDRLGWTYDALHTLIISQRHWHYIQREKY